ncbi:hypothetical protein L9F63_016052 [Diploptera punctata]|uniref:Cytochrome P450 n=1 Tax=Diploptera punctata TaxID=6984 RepID=A0AAD8A1K1_DIPPU|nr:hypothetical protein L9F63_016052 [Diploptera punctata]
MMSGKLSYPEFLTWVYNELKGHQYGGVFCFNRPIIFLRDPDLIKTITVKDFEYFTDHLTIIKEEEDVLWGKGIFNLQGQRWKDMRSILSPAFTSTKMKTMFHLVSQCGKQLIDFLDNCCNNHIPEKTCKVEKEGGLLVVELKDLLTRYSNDVIATSAFGIGVDSLKKPSNEFYLMGKEATNFRLYVWMGYSVFPKLMQMLNIDLIPKKVKNFFRALIKNTMVTRERDGIERPDLIQMLMQTYKSRIQDDKMPLSKRKMDDDDLIAQAFLFFVAGFESTATAMCFSCHQIGVYPEIESKLQQEIDKVMRESGGNITYEAINSMKYLDMVISETLRLFPPTGAMDRVCIKPYTLQADPPLDMKPGDGLWIPIYAVHQDPENFPDPEKFDPERFNDENKHNIKPSTYIPFGIGPRICIGSRFALMETKILLVYLLHHFNLKVVSKTPNPVKIKKHGFIMVIEGGFWMGLEKRNQSRNML